MSGWNYGLVEEHARKFAERASGCVAAAVEASPKARGRVREPKGQNKTEAQYDAHLAMLLRIGEIAWYRWEPFNIRISESCFWLVDFAVMLSDGTIEFRDTKGTKKMKRTSGEVYGKPYITEDATVKLRAVAEMYPFVVKAVYFYENEWKEKIF